MDRKLKGSKIALLVTDGFEQVELTEPKAALEDAGAEAVIVSPKADTVKGWKSVEWGDEFPVDINLSEADPSEFDGLVLPGGVLNPDHLRMNSKAVKFVEAFVEGRKPVAAICHGPWTLVETGSLKGRRLTSYVEVEI